MCDHRLADGPLVCMVTGPHTTHVFAASSLGDLHDVSEAASEATR